MTEDAEPEVNISGGETGYADTFEAGVADTRAEAVVDRLGEIYWQKTYGGRDGFECLVRTILSQNTSDKASQPAHDDLMAKYGPGEARSASDSASGERERDATGRSVSDERTASDASREQSEPRADGDLAENLAAADRTELGETISSAGLYNQKSRRLIDIARQVVEEYGSAAEFDAFVKEEDPSVVRETLLEFDGVGPKTADCVLLFAGGRAGVFPVDTHVHRIARRLGIAPADADHEEVRAALEATVPEEKCGFGHTAMIQFGREYCTARKPACLDDPEACPLADLCDQLGVSPETGEVVDPAEATRLAGD